MTNVGNRGELGVGRDDGHPKEVLEIDRDDACLA
jgi:hypothetical protein